MAIAKNNFVWSGPGEPCPGRVFGAQPARPRRSKPAMGKKLPALAIILMIQPRPRQSLLKFGGPFYQEKCRRGGQAAPGCLCGIASLDTGQPFQECPPCYGEIGFVCAGILTKKSSLKGSIANLQEFQPKNCYNASGAVRGASQPGGLRGEPVAHPQSPRHRLRRRFHGPGIWARSAPPGRQG